MSKRKYKTNYCVYKITNTINGKIYIGLTGNFNARKREHKCESKRNSRNLPIYNAMNKYGFKNFKFEIIENYNSLEEMVSGEIKWIQFYKSQDREFGYNLRGGGEVPYHNIDSIKKQQLTSYLNGPRACGSNVYKNVYKTRTGDYKSSIQVFGKRIHLGHSRTEVEAAWAYDVAARKYFPSGGVYLNFPSGKTRELIREQFATKRIIETIKFTHYNIETGKSYSNYFYVRGKDIKTGKVFSIVFARTMQECQQALDEFIKRNKSIQHYKNSPFVLQREYEKLHGSIYDLFSEDELEAEIKRESNALS